MTDKPTETGNSPSETPTAPLPTAPEITPEPEAAGAPRPTATFDSYGAGRVPAPAHPHVHTLHTDLRPGAVVAIVAGVLLFALLAFGVGWSSRGAVDHMQLARMHRFGAPGYSQGMGGGFGGRGTQNAPGFGQGNGSGNGQGYSAPGTGGMGRGYGRRNMMGLGQIPSQSATQAVPPVPAQ